MNSRYNVVGPGYFTTFAEPMIAGRDFTLADNEGAPRVAIVNETFAKRFGLGRNAIGRHMSVNNDSLNIEIVGVAKDAKYKDVKGKTPAVFVLPYRQYRHLTSTEFYVRSPLPTEQVARAIRNVVGRIDPNLPIEDVKTMTQRAREDVFLDRMISTMSASFAALATLLAAIGLYGVLAYSVTQRTREIGVRMALGADGGRMRAMVLRQVGTTTLVGGVIGIGGAVALGRSAQSLLFGLDAADPIVFALATTALTAVAFAAGYLPARRASRIDPMAALRYE
jgi:predicted permease